MEKRRRKGASYCTQEGKGRVTIETPSQNDREAVHRPSTVSRSTHLEQFPNTLEMQKHALRNFHDNRNNDPRSSFQRGNQAHSPLSPHQGWECWGLWKLTLTDKGLLSQWGFLEPSIPVTPPMPGWDTADPTVALHSTAHTANGKNMPMKECGMFQASRKDPTNVKNVCHDRQWEKMKSNCCFPEYC